MAREMFELIAVSKKELSKTDKETMRAIYGDDENSWDEVEDEEWPTVIDLNSIIAFNPFEDKDGNLGLQTIIRVHDATSYRIAMTYEDFKAFYSSLTKNHIQSHAIQK